MQEKVSSIDILVHPGFCQISRRGLPSHPIQNRVATSWDSRVQQLAKQEGSILLYFSPAVNSIEGTYAQETQRIQRYREILGERFVMQPRDLPNISNIKKEFAQRSFQFDPNLIVSVWAYGEYFEDCVAVWAEQVIKGLGIPRERYIGKKELSLSMRDRDEIFREDDSRR